MDAVHHGGRDESIIHTVNGDEDNVHTYCREKRVRHQSHIEREEEDIIDT